MIEFIVLAVGVGSVLTFGYLLGKYITTNYGE